MDARTNLTAALDVALGLSRRLLGGFHRKLDPELIRRVQFELDVAQQSLDDIRELVEAQNADDRLKQMRTIWLDTSYFCSNCLADFEEEDLTRRREPHGEVLTWSPCCNVVPLKYDELDTTDKERVDAKYG